MRGLKIGRLPGPCEPAGTHWHDWSHDHVFAGLQVTIRDPAIVRGRLTSHRRGTVALTVEAGTDTTRSPNDRSPASSLTVPEIERSLKGGSSHP
jgi:hypothetical protein